MADGLRKLDGGGNMVHIWWFWCDEMMTPPPSDMTKARGRGYGIGGVVFGCS